MPTGLRPPAKVPISADRALWDEAMLDLEFALTRYFGDYLENEGMNTLGSRDGLPSILVCISRILYSYEI